MAALSKASRHIYLPVATEGEEPTEYDGQTKTLAEWASITFLSKQLIWDRLNRGYSARQALFYPRRPYTRKSA